MFTARMKHLTAVVPRKDAEAVSRELLQIGILDFVKMTDLDREYSDSLTRVEEKSSAVRISESRSRIENLVAPLDPPLLEGVSLTVEDTGPVDLDKLEKELEQTAGRLQELRNRQREINQEILKLEDLRRQVSLYSDLQGSIGDSASVSNNSSFLATLTGSLPAEQKEEAERQLHRYPSVVLDFDELSGRVPLLVIGLRRDSRDISRILTDCGWTAEDLPLKNGVTREHALADLKTKIGNLQGTQKKLADQYTSSLIERGDWFRAQWAALMVTERLGTMRSYFSRTERTVVFSGWVPQKHEGKVEPALKKCCGPHYYLEWHEPREVTTASQGRVSTPVKLNNPHFLKPFEMLVENYAVPEYGTIDPTPLVAIAFLAMFGLMFADAGQGLVLMLIGLLGPRIKKGLSLGTKRLFTLIAYCGATAIFSGVLFGSYFGRPWIPPLWFDYHALIAGHGSGNPAIRSVYDILLITIWFGISILVLGLILNWINLIRKRRWLELFFDKAGVFGGWIYGCGIYTAFYFAKSGYVSLPGGRFLLIAFGIPGLLLFLKHPLHARQHHPDFHFSVGVLLNFLMEWIVELLEVFSGYLANTLSFMRVAGLGIAHVSLMLAFDEIAAMTATAGGSYSIWSILILVLGNILVLALEGLSAGIQALRLNYYEFFSKYFTGSGRAYAPISLRSKFQEDT
jgi:V/A-type H+/Na+-transporting ATPase subunit I